MHVGCAWECVCMRAYASVHGNVRVCVDQACVRGKMHVHMGTQASVPDCAHVHGNTCVHGKMQRCMGTHLWAWEHICGHGNTCA